MKKTGTPRQARRGKTQPDTCSETEPFQKGKTPFMDSRIRLPRLRTNKTTKPSGLDGWGLHNSRHARMTTVIETIGEDQLHWTRYRTIVRIRKRANKSNAATRWTWKSSRRIQSAINKNSDKRPRHNLGKRIVCLHYIVRFVKSGKQNRTISNVSSRV